MYECKKPQIYTYKCSQKIKGNMLKKSYALNCYLTQDYWIVYIGVDHLLLYLNQYNNW